MKFSDLVVRMDTPDPEPKRAIATTEALVQCPYIHFNNESKEQNRYPLWQGVGAVLGKVGYHYCCFVSRLLGCLSQLRDCNRSKSASWRCLSLFQLLNLNGTNRNGPE
jgi:hypothetical protein